MGPTQALQSPKGHRIHSKTSKWKQNGEGMTVCLELIYCFVVCSWHLF